jgi:hypothetical protein
MGRWSPGAAVGVAEGRSLMGLKRWPVTMGEAAWQRVRKMAI